MFFLFCQQTLHFFIYFVLNSLLFVVFVFESRLIAWFLSISDSAIYNAISDGNIVLSLFKKLHQGYIFYTKQVSEKHQFCNISLSTYFRVIFQSAGSFLCNKGKFNWKHIDLTQI